MEENRIPEVLTVKEIATALRVHQSTIYKMLRRGELPAFRVGTDWRITAKRLQEWMETLDSQSPADRQAELTPRVDKAITRS